MDYSGLTIQARIYPDAEDFPEGYVRWWIEPHEIEVVGRYYLLQDVESGSDFPRVMMKPEIINLQHAIILHGIEAYQPPIPFAGYRRFLKALPKNHNETSRPSGSSRAATSTP